MTWKPGQSGNPHGRNPERMATDTLRIAVMEVIKSGRHKGKTKLRRVGEKIAQCAMNGEPWACALIYDRLDGKPLQVIDQTTTYQAGEVFLDLLRRIAERRALTIEHSSTEHRIEDRAGANGGVAAVRADV